jgi:protein TonB
VQTRNAIVNIPLLLGIMLSIAVHVAALYSRGMYTPAEPILESGQTVVQLTLLPSRASAASAPAPVLPEPQPEEPAEVVSEPPPTPPIPVEPLPTPAPVPEPAAAPQKEAPVSPPQEPVKQTIPEPAPQISSETAAVDAIEQDATLQSDKGVIADAQSTSSISPAYPRISRRRGEEGIVTLSIQVLASGKAGSIKVIGSSGYERLDQAARKAVKNASFKPATQLGRSIDSTTELSFTFRLTDD